ncbi:MAG: OmpH family outer membrane protein [Candidatus Riflebacteria bacterium]|nr:OmpH family outer membrane protein [Candidatus Riflebacteria bacterium]
MVRRLFYSAFIVLFMACPTASFCFSFGYIDAAKVFAKYSETQKTKSYLESEKSKLQEVLDSKKKAVADLDAKYLETAKKLQALRDAKKDKEVEALEPTLKTQREELANANAELQKFFEESQKKLYEVEEEKMGSLSKFLDEKMDPIIQQIAQAKSLEAVFEKRFCYFGGVDITEEVLATLNTLKPVKGAATAAPATTKKGTKGATAKPAENAKSSEGE